MTASPEPRRPRFRPAGPPPPGDRQPAINLPPMVKALVFANIGVFLLQVLMSDRAEAWMVFNLGFLPARYTLAPFIEWPALAGPFTHQFLHGGWLHLAMNTVMLAAFGSGVERVLGGRKLLLVYVLSGLAGALAHFALQPEGTVPVIGASGAISGLFGVVLRMMGEAQSPGGNGFQRMLPIALLWIGIAVITGFTGVPGAGGAQVAWAAHVGGFLAGLLLFGPLRPRRRVYEG